VAHPNITQDESTGIGNWTDEQIVATPDLQRMAPAGPDKMFSGALPFEIPMLGTGKLWARNITSDPETGIGLDVQAERRSAGGGGCSGPGGWCRSGRQGDLEAALTPASTFTGWTMRPHVAGPSQRSCAAACRGAKPGS
jgi:hypothetical protein